MDEKVNLILVDLATVKTDVAWLKRLFVGGIIGVGAILGIDMTGLMA
jgi:hypothetical protein